MTNPSWNERKTFKDRLSNPNPHAPISKKKLASNFVILCIAVSGLLSFCAPRAASHDTGLGGAGGREVLEPVWLTDGGERSDRPVGDGQGGDPTGEGGAGANSAENKEAARKQANLKAQEHVKKEELSLASPAIQKLAKAVENKPHVILVNILGSFGQYTALDHKAGAAVDIPTTYLPDKVAARNYFESFGLTCDVHANYSGREVPIDSAGAHFHCHEQGFTGLRGITITSYNPDPGQTDDTPCIAGGTGINICDLKRTGVRPIAFSQDVVKWSGGKYFSAGDKVKLVSTDFPDDWRCNGEFIVADAMNARYRKRGDIFFLERANNISCHANIYRL